MFLKYFALWSKENLLLKAFKRTVKMLEYDREMFEAAVHALRDTNSAKLSIDIYERDKKINKYEREVRRNVLTHLAISGERDYAPGLALVSIVIDVERIGDYAKNIADLAREHPKKLEADIYEELLSDLELKITQRFQGFEQILIGGDKKLARELMNSHTEISANCDKITTAMVQYKEGNLSASNTAALAMYARFLKRISSHLTNIASSVVNPFARIGYKEKKK